MDAKKIRIGYLTSRNAKDKKEWSGTLFYMAKSLSKNAGEVVFLGPYDPSIIRFILKVINKLSLLIFKKKYGIAHSNLISYAFRRRFMPLIKKEKVDVIFGAAATPELSRLKTSIPIINLNDTTYDLLIDAYPNFTNLSSISVREGRSLERRALELSDAVVYSSEWAAESARNDFNVSPEKIHIIPYGANMDKLPTKEKATRKTIGIPLKLLFLGVDWVRKGGEIAFKTFLELKKRGLDVELTVIGCSPPMEYNDPDMKVIPFLNKNDEKDAGILYDILMESNFLFVPSKSDCTPIVFCEANAFGMPVITTNAGGIGSVIAEGINGHMLSTDAGPQPFADIFSSYYNDPQNYQRIVKTSRESFEKTLNWDTWGESVNKLMLDLLKNDDASSQQG